MLYPVAGSRLFIADAPAQKPGPFPVSGWVEVGEAEALGLLGMEWEEVNTTHFGSYDPDGNPTEETIKGSLRRPRMDIILGNDPVEPGQAILWQAAWSRDSYPFRLVFPDGATVRMWFALVMSIGEVFDTANGVMKLQASLKPSSHIQRSEAG